MTGCIQEATRGRGPIGEEGRQGGVMYRGVGGGYHYGTASHYNQGQLQGSQPPVGGPGYPSYSPYQSPYASLYARPPPPPGQSLQTQAMYPSQQPQPAPGYPFGYQPGLSPPQGKGWGSGAGMNVQRPPPPESYVCHKCSQKGHWITDCQKDAPHRPGAEMQGRQVAGGGRRGGRGRGARGGDMQQPRRGGGGGGRGGRGNASSGRGGAMATATEETKGPQEGWGNIIKKEEEEEVDEDSVDDVDGLEYEDDDQGAENGDEQEEDAKFYCETCEKGFPVESQYQAHLTSHAKCTSPGCEFTGSKRVLLAHYHARHGKYKGSGFRMFTVEGRKYRLLVGEKPEEVEQWRQERAKNFPTAVNIAKRTAERPAAGGRFSNNRKRGRDTSSSVPASKVSRVEGQPTPSVKPLVSGYDSSGDEGGGEGGTKDGEDASGGQQEPVRSVLYGVCRAFLRGQCTSGNHCRYRHGPQKRGGPSYCRYFTRPGGQCRHGDECQFVHDEELKKELTIWVEDRRALNQQNAADNNQGGVKQEGEATSSANTSNRGQQQVRQKPVPRPPQQQPTQKRDSTLLRKLLGIEAERETRLVLECVRFLVSNRFLRGGHKQPGDMEALVNEEHQQSTEEAPSSNGSDRGVTVGTVEEQEKTTGVDTESC